MKFKISKLSVSSLFSFLNKLEKLRLVQKDNKSDNLIFYGSDSQLLVFLDNGLSSCFYKLDVEVTNPTSFSTDVSTFYNSLTAFPTDDIQFAYIPESNSLIFGNKKSRVNVFTNTVEDVEKLFKSTFEYPMCDFYKLDVDKFNELIKYTSFSCAPDYDEFPYSSIMIFGDDNNFSGQSSDKHRISLYGDKYTDQKSYLLSKTSSDLIANIISEFDNFEYSVCKGKFILTWNSGTLITTCENNEYQNVFHNFSKFFDESELLFSFSLEKQEILKSLKFIGNISNSHIVEFNFSSQSLVLTSKSNDKGGALDKIVLTEAAPDLKVSYLSNHLTKVLEVLNEKVINFNIYNYNDFNLLMVECTNFKHLIFPME